MLPYYAGALAVVLVCIWVTVTWGTAYPTLQILCLGVCTYVGKLVGMPLERVYTYALQKKPEKALALAVQALQSIPPERIDQATRELISSIPPAAIPAAQRVLLVNTTEPPPAAPPTSAP